MILFFIFLLFTISHSVASNYPFPEKVGETTVIDFLKTAPIASIEPMQDHLKSLGKSAVFNSEVFLITLTNNIKAVLKPTNEWTLRNAHAEVAAYKASEFLEFNVVPPTVLRTINNQTGSLQLYIETDIDLLAPACYQKILHEVSADEKTNLAIFYFVLGQWDNWAPNILAVTKNGATHLIAIDNSGISARQHVVWGQRPFVRIYTDDALSTNDWDSPFPFENAQNIYKVTQEKVRKIFGTTVDEEFYARFKTPTKINSSFNKISYNYGGTFRYVIYQNGIWRQYFGDNGLPITHCPKLTRQILEELTIDKLKQILKDSLDVPPFNHENFFISILERRDLVLKHVYQDSL